MCLWRLLPLSQKQTVHVSSKVLTTSCRSTCVAPCLCSSSNKVCHSQACNHLVWSRWFMAAGKINKSTGLLEWPKREPSAFVWALQCIHACAYADLCLHWSTIPIKQEYARESIDPPSLTPPSPPPPNPPRTTESASPWGSTSGWSRLDHDAAGRLSWSRQ